MNILLAALVAQAIANHQPISVDFMGRPCEQVAPIQCLPLTNDAVIVPAGETEEQPIIVLPQGSMYSVFQATTQF